MKAQGSDPVLPFNPAPHLTDWLIEIGPAAPGGEDAIGYMEMAAWSRLTGIDLNPWEVRTLRRLSRSFVSQRAISRKPSCLEPRLQADEVSARARVDEQFKAMMGALRQRQQAVTNAS